MAGGIPILGPLSMDLAGNTIHAVRGIVNGTTNHILSAMARDARTYPDVLAEARHAATRRSTRVPTWRVSTPPTS